MASSPPGSYLLVQFLASLLFGVGIHDPQTFLGITVLLIAVALAASYIPTRRAMRVDPIIALRYELRPTWAFRTPLLGGSPGHATVWEYLEYGGN